MKRFSYLIIAAVTILSTFSYYIVQPKQAAAQVSRSQYCGSYCVGYFTGVSASASIGTVYSAIAGGIGTSGSGQSAATAFENTVYNYLYSGTVNTGAGVNEVLGAAMIIDVMMGTGPGSNGVQTAKNNYSKWKALVDAYVNPTNVAAGYSVNFNASYTGPINSAYFTQNTSGRAMNDDAFHNNVDGNGNPNPAVPAIEFIWPGGHFSIEKSCGNLMGTVSVPPPPSSKPGPGPGPSAACPEQPGVDITKVLATFPTGEPTTSGPPTKADPGGTYTVRTVTGHRITAATDANTGKALTYGATTVNFTVSVTDYPYDSNKANVTYVNEYDARTYDTLTGRLIAGPTHYTTSASHTDGYANLGECYYRNFDVQPAGSTNVTGVTLNGYENPSQATVYTQLAVKFSLPHPPTSTNLRAAMHVKGLAYQGTYEIRRANGSVVPLTSGNYAYPDVGSTTADGGIITDTSNNPVIGVAVGTGANQLRPGDEVCAQFIINPGSGQVNENGDIMSSSGSVSSTAIPTPPTCSQPVVNEPYFKVFGGDISTGSTFKSKAPGGAITCAPNNSSNGASGVYGWNTAGDVSNTYVGQKFAGAGAQFGINALGLIEGAASDQNNPNANVAATGSPGTGLSFANSGLGVTVNSAAGKFGGSSLIANCMPDYYDDKPTSGVPTPLPPNLSGADKTYVVSGPVTINGGNIATNKHVVIYVDGDVYISNDINFVGSYASIDQVPSLVLVARGDIYIKNTVKTLSGIFIAQPKDPNPAGGGAPTDGNIYDCSTGFSPVSTTNLFSGCNTQLTVNGSFIANKVNLMRTGNAAGDPIKSSLRGSSTNESNSITSTTTVPANMTSTCASGSAPDASGLCGSATYNPGGTSYGPWSGWSADTRGCGVTYGSPPANTATTQYNSQYVSGICGAGYRVQSRSVSTSPGYYSCPGSETLVSGNNCKASTAYSCPDGSSPVGPGTPPNCVMATVPTNAAEIFNYSPVFWMNVNLPQPTSTSAGYDSVVSMPPIF